MLLNILLVFILFFLYFVLYQVHRVLLYRHYSKKLRQIQAQMAYQSLVLADVIEVSGLDKAKFSREVFNSNKLQGKINLVQSLKEYFTEPYFKDLYQAFETNFKLYQKQFSELVKLKPQGKKAPEKLSWT